jgi:CRISPR-associated protein Cmr3
MRIFIEPIEPLLFRTGRPFDAGQDNFAESLFPPTPETLQGAVRATVAAYWHPQKNIAEAFKEDGLTQRIGDQQSYGRFRITGLGLGRYAKTDPQTIECLFVPPAHIMKAGMSLHRLIPRPFEKSVTSNFPDARDFYLAPKSMSEDAIPNDDLKPLDGWLTKRDLDDALGRGDITSIKPVKRTDIYLEEPRLGIGIQRGTKAAEEGYLYQVVMIRMNPNPQHDYIYGFVVDIQLTPASPGDAPLTDAQTQQELHLPDAGWMTIGGEQRPAHFRILPTPPGPTTKPPRKRSLLYLATPAVLDDGWKPSSKLAPLDTPLTAAITRYEPIGGWKLDPRHAGGGQKAIRRCVPAGSVYFFDKPLPSLPAFTQHDIEIGYGIYFEGEW